MEGTFDASVLSMKDSLGVTLRDAVAAFGLNPEWIGTLARVPGDVIVLVETHIEQGPVLEQADEAIGVVTVISRFERHQIEVIGETGHAGTLPMTGRRDALVGAAANVAEVDQLGNPSPICAQLSVLLASSRSS